MTTKTTAPSMFERNRVRVTVSFTVQREMFPGTFYDPQDFATFTVKAVENQLVSYKPSDFETEVVDPQGGPVAPPLDLEAQAIEWYIRRAVAPSCSMAGKFGCT